MTGNPSLTGNPTAPGLCQRRPRTDFLEQLATAGTCRGRALHSAPEVNLDLVGAPNVVKEGGEVVRTLLKLQPEAATAVERLTRNSRGRQIAIVLGGEVVTMHKARDVIKGGEVQMAAGRGSEARSRSSAQRFFSHRISDGEQDSPDTNSRCASGLKAT